MNRIIAQAEAWVNKIKHDDNSIVRIKPSSVDLHKSLAYGIVETSKNLHAVCIGNYMYIFNYINMFYYFMSITHIF